MEIYAILTRLTIKGSGVKMDNYLEKIQDKNNLIDKIIKMQKNLLKTQIILLFIILYLLIFKNIFILKLFCLVPMLTISIISTILTEEVKKLRNEILELSREVEFWKEIKMQDNVLEIIKRRLENEEEIAYADFEEYAELYGYDETEDYFSFGLKRAIEIISVYIRLENEKEQE